jgi:hypothetical protein
MQHRRPHLSKKAKMLLASSVALAAAAGVTVAQAGEDSKKCGAFDTKNNADWQDQPTDEVMVWLNRQGGAGPLGTKYGSVSLGGAMWDIYQGDIGWKVYSFVRRTNTTRADLDLDDFTQALVRRKLLSNNKYLSGIESGSEVFRGSGRLDTKSYSVDIG